MNPLFVAANAKAEKDAEFSKPAYPGVFKCNKL